jgi:NDP-sugar pyrophosphorylase family protein
MKIVIPMSGLGQRFVDAGYSPIKPLIPVLGKPIIEWVLTLFPGQDDFLFICRDEHLQSTPLQDELMRLKPNAKIVGIKGHKKGPVYAVTKALDEIDDKEQVLVSYCDYYMQWNYPEFLRKVTDGNYDGAIPCYTGFHPHLLPEKNLYASCDVDDEQCLIEIREKHSFTKDKTKSLHSPGMYYFKSGEILKKYCQLMLEKDIHLNGEYYVSLVYNLMVQDSLKVWAPSNVPHFCQWGTPEDLEAFLFWASAVKGAAK